MALNAMGLGFLFTAKDLASGIMGKVRGNFNKFADDATKKSSLMKGSFAAIGPGLVAMGIGLSGIALGFEAANQFGDFEQGLAGVRSVMRASDKDFAMLREAALNAGIATQFSPTEAVEGLTELATAGQTATEAVKTLIPVLDLSAGSLGKLGVAGSAQAVIGTLNAYSLSADHAADVTDRLLRITELTNFQAKDFETGLSKAASAGGVFNQDLNDVLITMGLLRNRNIDASSSSTAYRESLRRLATDAHASKAALAAGVDIYDKGSGKLRQLVDITQDFADKTANMTEKQRNHLIVQAFGARGLLAFAAIQKAQFTATENGVTTTYKGAAAIEHLRKTMGETNGTAERFREALLNTFKGQKTLLHGSLMTLGIVAGEGFAQVFKPVVSGIIFGVNMLVRVIKATPGPMKQFFAAVWLLTSTLVTFAGMATLATAAVILLLPALKVVAIGFGVAAIAAAPLLIAIGALTLGFIALRYAYENNLGGLGGTTRKIFSDIGMAWRAMGQLFAQGGFSGAVLLEMRKAENEGVRNFAITVYVWAARIKNFFSGIAAGFGEALRENEPVFSAFSLALDRLSVAFNRLFDSSVDVDANRDKWLGWGSAGESTGRKIGDAAVLIVKGISWTIEKITQAITLFDWFSDIISDTGPLNGLSDGFKDMSREIGRFNDRLEGTNSKSEEWASGWLTGFRIVMWEVRLMGAIVGGVFGLLADVFRGLTNVVDSLKASVWGTVELMWGALTGDGARAWGGFKIMAFGALMAVKGAVMGTMQVLARLLDMLVNVGGGHGTATSSLADFDKQITAGINKSMGVTIDANGNPVMTPQGPTATPVIDSLLSRPPPVNPDAGVQADLAKTLPGVGAAEASASQFAAYQAQNAEFLKNLGATPINLTSTTNLMLDDDKLATAVVKAKRKRNSTSFDSGADAQE